MQVGQGFTISELKALTHHLISFFFFFNLTAAGLTCSMQDLFPWPGIEPRPPALGAQSLSHWTTTLFLKIGFCTHTHTRLYSSSTQFLVQEATLSEECWQTSMCPKTTDRMMARDLETPPHRHERSWWWGIQDNNGCCLQKGFDVWCRRGWTHLASEGRTGGAYMAAAGPFLWKRQRSL